MCKMFGHGIPICLNEIHCVVPDNYICVCEGLVGVTLGDGQSPIGSDLKRHALFFQETKIGHECPSQAVSFCMSRLFAPAFIRISRVLHKYAQ